MADARTERITIRLKLRDWVKLRQMAEAANMTVNEFVRKALWRSGVIYD